MSPLPDKRERASPPQWRLHAIRGGILLAVIIIAGRLFSLQVLQAAYWKYVSENQHSFYEELVPRRGRILVKDYRDDTEYPVASVTQTATVYADPRKVTDPVGLSVALARILAFPDIDEYQEISVIEEMKKAGREEEAVELEKIVLTERAVTIPENLEEIPALYAATLEESPNSVAVLVARLSKKDDPSEPVSHRVTEAELELINALDNDALYYTPEDTRSYPEGDFSGQVTGFLGKDDAGKAKGYYGIEGYFNDFLAGKPGELYSQKDSSGNWIGVGQRKFVTAVDGGDVLLTIDRTLEVTACKMLAEGVKQYDADGGALVIIEPKTGRILAMCGAPDFNPATYGSVEDFSTYNNSTIFTPYEPGSIMKPLVMAAAMDVGAVKPETTFTDTGSVEIDDFTIKNSGDKIYGLSTMVEVLENSINTGMVWVMRKMGRDTLQEYFERYGFGELTGVELKTEATGTIASLNEPAEIYPATASFGQGVTVTPLQIAAAYAALANNGLYMKPHIVDELRYADGTVEKITPEAVRQVVSLETAKKISAMLISVVEYGHGKKAGVPGYYIAGKTGTAQIAEGGVYSETNFNGSFAGYGPKENPRFAMVVKITNPKKGIIYAESTAAPIFGEIADFLLEYYGVAPERTTE